jgi:hypothetical protein
MVLMLRVTLWPMGSRSSSASLAWSPWGLWAISGASMQASRTVIAPSPLRTRIVSPSPTESTVAVGPATAQAGVNSSGVNASARRSLWMGKACRATCPFC